MAAVEWLVGATEMIRSRVPVALKNAPPWVVSLVFHVAVLLLLALATFMPSGLVGPRFVIDLGSASVAPDIAIESTVDLGVAGDMSDVAIAEVAEAMSVGDVAADPASALDAVALDLPPRDSSTALMADLPGAEILNREFSPTARKLGVVAERAKPDRPRWTGFKPQAATAPAEGITAAADATGAANGLLGTLGTDLEEGQTYVAWVLDASISLTEDRRSLAKTLEPFVKAEWPKPGKPGRLLTAVVAFGAGVNLMADFSPYANLKAIENLPIDPSGRENVMSAVLAVVIRFQQRFHNDVKRRHRLRIVIWTDESGDDTSLLEEAIAACRATGTVVHVVGPSSVFGTDRGLQPWTVPGHGRFLLPVTRGPDSFLQERVLLPYWFDDDDDAGAYEGVLVADGRQWFGGPLRERLMAGIGPYSLTRLSLQTGGTFRILDRPGETAPFDLERMKDYLPDYGSAYEIVEAVGASPLRMAVMNAVRRTHLSADRSTPQLQFLAPPQTPVYPFRFYSPGYCSPEVFRVELPSNVAAAVQPIRQSAQMAEEALMSFIPAIDWEYEYAKEPSRRWQAWYDLTRGRLLAMSVRYQEYLAICNAMVQPNGLRPPTNRVLLGPGPQLCGENLAIRNRTAEAIRLLERCRERNRGTPWELLADWELNTPAGFSVREIVVPPPPPPPPGVQFIPMPPQPSWPRITFPAL